VNPIELPRVPLAYKNEAFLDSDDARPLRILSEYLQPLYAFQRDKICGTVVFFGSARLNPDGPLGHYYEAARELARLVTQWSMELSSQVCHCVVCTGGGGGIMEAATRGAVDVGDETRSSSRPFRRRRNAHCELCRKGTYLKHSTARKHGGAFPRVYRASHRSSIVLTSAGAIAVTRATRDVHTTNTIP
jgi:hypothetical protein